MLGLRELSSAPTPIKQLPPFPAIYSPGVSTKKTFKITNTVLNKHYEFAYLFQSL